MNKCSVCSWIISKTRDRRVIFENDDIIAVLDESPKARGHTLVILKDHTADNSSVLPILEAAMERPLVRIATAIKQALGAEFVCRASIGDLVGHVQYHLIPRYGKDPKGFVHFMSSRGKLSDEPDAGLEIAGKIRATLRLIKS